jgi:DNA polymerase Ligase (LigD)
MPRFVVLTHDHPTLHWDLLLEEGKILRTWRLAQPPDASHPIDAEALPNHRLAYLEYEGPISGGRGTVERWDAGEYDVVDSIPAQFVVRLAGAKIRGEFALEQIRESAQWIFRRRDVQTEPN